MSLHSSALNSLKLCYSAIPKSRYEEVIEFLGRYFFSEEPVSKSLNLAPNTCLPREVRILLSKRFDEGSSLMAVEETSNKVIAAVTSCVMTPEAECDVHMRFRKMVESHPNWGVLYQLQQELCKDGDRFQLVGSDRVFDICHVAVMPQFRKFHIANELVARTVALAQSRGDCQVALAYPTTLSTFRILSRLGFEMIAKVNVSNVKFNGKPLVDDCDVFYKLMARNLRDTSPP